MTHRQNLTVVAAADQKAEHKFEKSRTPATAVAGVWRCGRRCSRWRAGG